MNIREVEILLVEDNANDAEMTIRALKRVNLANKLVHLVNGEEALNFLFAHGEFKERKNAAPPRVILLDIKMPKVDGIEVLKQIKADSRTKTIPVIIMTTSSSERDRQLSYELGANCFVTKPDSYKELIEVTDSIAKLWFVNVS